MTVTVSYEPGCWLHPGLTTGPSDIAGTGLFASAPILEGADVAVLGGRLVSTAELQALSADDGDVESFVIEDDSHLVLPAASLLRFGNHSCEPSVAWSGGYTLVALRDLSPGEEVSFDYATSTADPGFLLRCHCETYRCRQMVEGTDWQMPALQRRYAGHWTPYLQRLIDGST